MMRTLAVNVLLQGRHGTEKPEKVWNLIVAPEKPEILVILHLTA